MSKPENWENIPIYPPPITPDQPPLKGGRYVNSRSTALSGCYVNGADREKPGHSGSERSAQSVPAGAGEGVAEGAVDPGLGPGPEFWIFDIFVEKLIL